MAAEALGPSRPYTALRSVYVRSEHVDRPPWPPQVWFFDLAPTLQLFLGILIACISINLYFMPKDSTPPKSVSLPVAVKAEAAPNTEVDRSR
eukprot:9471896-Pyramimonas_sp.AAC.1